MRSSKKGNATEHGTAILSFQKQNKLSGCGGVEEVGNRNATEREKHKKKGTPPSKAVPIRLLASKTSVLAIEGLKK